MPLTQQWKAPIVNLQNWVAASPTLWELLNVASQAAALPSIYLQDALGNFNGTRVIVGADGRRKLTKTSTTGWRLDSPLFIEWEIDQSNFWNKTTGAIDHNGAAANFLGQIEAIWDDLSPLCGTGSYPDIIEVEESGPPLPREETKTAGKYYWSSLWTVQLRG